MKIRELRARYDNHPLGFGLRQFDEAGDLDALHRMYIAVKTMTLLLRYQGELSKSDATAIEGYVEARVSTCHPGSRQEVVS